MPCRPVAAVLLGVAVPVLAGLHGTYTIKPDGSGNFRTLYEAAGALNDSGVAGDCVFEVYGDTLDANATLDMVAGSDSCTITFRPGPGEHPVLTGGRLVAGATDNLKVEGLEFRFAGVVARRCSGLRISGCRLTGIGGTGIALHDCAGDSVIGNVLVSDEDGADDMLFAEAGRGLVIANNFISGSVSGAGASQGLVTVNWVEAAGVFYNTFRVCPLELESGTALLFDDLEGVRADFRNNLLILAPPADTLNACVGYHTATPESLRADFNCYHVESLGYIGLTDDTSGPAPLFLDWTDWQALGFDPHGINADPLVVGPANLHLAEGSPCIGAGIPIPGVLTDIDGDPRDPAHPDIGADEFAGGAVAEPTPGASRRSPAATVIRNAISLQSASADRQSSPALLDASGRRVMDLRPGENDTRHLAPGIYYVVTRARGVAGRVVKVR